MTPFIGIFQENRAKLMDTCLARSLVASPPALPAEPEADLPAQLDRLRHILELVEHYLYPRGGPLHAHVAAVVGTPDRPLTARRVALLHEADPEHLTDVTGDELAQVASFALREPERLARDPDAASAAAANLDLAQAVAIARRRLGVPPRVREEPDLGTWRGWHEYATSLRREVRKRQPDAPYRDGARLNWGRREDGPPGPPPRLQPVARSRARRARQDPAPLVDGQSPRSQGCPARGSLIARRRVLRVGRGGERDARVRVPLRRQHRQRPLADLPDGC